MKTKNMVLRLEPGLAERLEAVAEVEGRSVSDVVREAITLLEDNVARHQRILQMLRDKR